MSETANDAALGDARGVVVWLVGLPSSGKSTLARAVAARLADAGTPPVLLDGDEVRATLRPAPGYDEPARDAFYESLSALAALVARQGHVVLVPATAHRAAFRARARAVSLRFVEVFVDTPPDECARRDPKGLYARALADPAQSTLPGVGVPFERPEHPDVVVRSGDADAVARVLAALG